jgi:HEAT repeat protein
MSRIDPQRVLAALQSPTEQVRCEAVRRLEEAFGGAVPVEPALRALGDERWQVRKCAVELLARIGSRPDILSALVGALGDEANAGLRNAATEALVRLGGPAVAAVQPLFDSPDKDLRKFAADILGAIARPECFEPLVRAIEDPEENVRAAAAEALGSFREGRAAQVLRQALQQDSLLVQISCLSALSRMGAEVPLEELTPHLQRGPLRPALFGLLARLDDERVLPLLRQGLASRQRSEQIAAVRALADWNRRIDIQRRVALRVALGQEAGETLIGTLRQMLLQGDPEGRAAAVLVLGWLGRVEFIAEMLQAAADPRLRDSVFDAIASMGPRAVEPLGRLLPELSSAGQALAAELLGHFRQGAAVSWLIDLCQQEDPEVAAAAQRALGQLGDARAIPALMDLVRRPGAPGASGAVGALLQLGGPCRREVLAALQPLLDTRDVEVRRRVFEVLCGVARQEDMEGILPLLGDEDPMLRAFAVRAMGRVGAPENLARLRMALTDETAMVREEAVRALSLRDDASVREALRLALADTDTAVVREALAGLGRLGGVEDAALVVPFLSHPEGMVALQAVRVLNAWRWPVDDEALRRAGRHPDPEVQKELLAGCRALDPRRARETLVAALGHPRWDVRLAAVRAAGGVGDPELLRHLLQRASEEEDPLVLEALRGTLAPEAVRAGD